MFSHGFHIISEKESWHGCKNAEMVEKCLSHLGNDVYSSFLLLCSAYFLLYSPFYSLKAGAAEDGCTPANHLDITKAANQIPPPPQTDNKQFLAHIHCLCKFSQTSRQQHKKFLELIWVIVNTKVSKN